MFRTENILLEALLYELTVEILLNSHFDKWSPPYGALFIRETYSESP